MPHTFVLVHGAWHGGWCWRRVAETLRAKGHTVFAPTLTGKGPFRDVYSVMNAWGANHGTISYGHIGNELITLASMLRIPVYMHNVDEERVFRPAAWTTFGTADAEAADFRACANFGPIYRKA